MPEGTGTPWGDIAGAVAGPILGLALGGYNDRRQINQQQKLQDQQIKGQKQMTDYNMSKQMEMWKATSYGGQMEQMNKAGVNPSLMYGMGGGGGQSTGQANGNVSGGSAPQGGREIQDITGMAMQMKAQLELLQAQKENINADTDNKKAETGYTGGVKTDNTKMDTTVKQQTQWSMGLDNAAKEYIAKVDLEGKDTSDYGGTMRAEGERQKLNITGAEIALKGKQWAEIAQKIELMGKQGMTQDQITQNLVKDGTLKDAEIEWNKIGLKQGDAGKFVVELIKKLVKGR